MTDKKITIKCTLDPADPDQAEALAYLESLPKTGTGRVKYLKRYVVLGLQRLAWEAGLNNNPIPSPQQLKKDIKSFGKKE